MHRTLIALLSATLLTACTAEQRSEINHIAYSSLAHNTMLDGVLPHYTAPLPSPSQSRIDYCFDALEKQAVKDSGDAESPEPTDSIEAKTAFLEECLGKANGSVLDGIFSPLDLPSVPIQPQIPPLPSPMQ